MDAWTILLVTVTAAALAMNWVLDRRRRAAVRHMALRRGFTYLGDVLPRSITLQGTSLEAVSSIWNVMEADRGAIRVLAFDCRIGRGKGSRLRTVISARGPRDVFGIGRFCVDLTFERSGEWTMMYAPLTFSLIATGLMPVSEVEAQIDSLGH